MRFALALILIVGIAQAQTRDPRHYPFTSDSPWNTSIKTGANYVPAGLSDYSTELVPNWTPMPQIDSDIIVLHPEAPLTPISKSSVAWNGGDRCTADTPKSVVHTVPIPVGYQIPSTSGNNAATFLGQDSRTLYSNQPLTICNTGSTTLLAFPVVDLYSQGISGPHGGSYLSGIGGTLRLGELRPGELPPHHVLKIEIDSRYFMHPCSVRTDCYRWPAAASDSNALTAYGSLAPVPGNIPSGMKMGALLAIQQSVDITKIGLETGAGQQLAWTLQNYGAYIADSTGGKGFTLVAEQGPDGNFTDQFQADWGMPMQAWVINNTGWVRDMQRIVRLLNVVDNNGPTTVGGTGQPLQPTLPDLKTQ